MSLANCFLAEALAKQEKTLEPHISLPEDRTNQLRLQDHLYWVAGLEALQDAKPFPFQMPVEQNEVGVLPLGVSKHIQIIWARLVRNLKGIALKAPLFTGGQNHKQRQKITKVRKREARF